MDGCAEDGRDELTYVRADGWTDRRRAGSRTAGQLDGCTDGQHTEVGPTCASSEGRTQSRTVNSDSQSKRTDGRTDGARTDIGWTTNERTHLWKDRWTADMSVSRKEEWTNGRTGDGRSGGRVHGRTANGRTVGSTAGRSVGWSFLCVCVRGVRGARMGEFTGKPTVLRTVGESVGGWSVGRSDGRDRLMDGHWTAGRLEQRTDGRLCRRMGGQT